MNVTGAWEQKRRADGHRKKSCRKKQKIAEQQQQREQRTKGGAAENMRIGITMGGDDDGSVRAKEESWWAPRERRK